MVCRERGPPRWGWVGGVNGQLTMSQEEEVRKCSQTRVRVTVLFLSLVCYFWTQKGDDVIIIDDDEVSGGKEGESEEESVVVLTEADIGGFSKPPHTEDTVGRGRRGRRGGRNTAQGPGERGRGRQTKKKRRKKQQN